MSRLDNIGKQFFDGNGEPLAGGKLYFYETGTTTLATTYSDSAESSANANPVILDAEGRMPDVFYPGFLKIVLRDANDVLIETRDPVGFSAAVTGIPNGGTTNQVLAKASDDNQDVEWQTVSGGSALWTWDTTVKTANFTAEVGKYHFVRSGTENTDVTMTFPSSPSVGDVFLVRNILNGTSTLNITGSFGVTVDDLSITSSLFIPSIGQVEAGTSGKSQHAGFIYLETNKWYTFIGTISQAA